jgi:hypothetical protein
MIAFAAMLLAACCAGWIMVAGISPAARAYARFAFSLYAALALAAGIDSRLADSVALIVSAVAPLLFVLALADVVKRPIASAFASLALGTACLAGMIAAATGVAALALGPLLLSVVAMIAVVLRDWRSDRSATIQAAVSAGALLAGASAFAAGGSLARATLCAFTSAGLLGAALAMNRRSHGVVEQMRPHGLRDAGAIRDRR